MDFRADVQNQGSEGLRLRAPVYLLHLTSNDIIIRLYPLILLVIVQLSPAVFS